MIIYANKLSIMVNYADRSQTEMINMIYEASQQTCDFPHAVPSAGGFPVLVQDDAFGITHCSSTHI